LSIGFKILIVQRGGIRNN